MSPEPPPPITPTSAVAARVKIARQQKNGMTAQQLGDAMTAAGFKWDRFVVQNLESGKRQNVTLAETLALAYILDIAPVHLMVSIDDEMTPVRVTPSGPDVRPDIARDWIRGAAAIGDVDVRRYATQVPTSEFGPKDGRIRYVEAEARGVVRGWEIERDDLQGFARSSFKSLTPAEAERLRDEFPMLFDDLKDDDGSR